MYDIRDLLGHWVKLPPRKNESGMCPHPCCRGRRPHPDRFPVILSKPLARKMTGAELERHLQRRDVGDDGEAVTRVVDELQRREDKTKQDRHRRRTGQESYRLWLENEWIQADEATRGNMLNKRGRARGVDPRSLWTANDRTKQAYASEELRAYWNAHPVLSSAEFGRQESADRARQRRRTSSLYGVY